MRDVFLLDDDRAVVICGRRRTWLDSILLRNRPLVIGDRYVLVTVGLSGCGILSIACGT